MLKKIVMAAFMAALTVLVVPAAVNAYGACRVSYGHYGSYGGYHTSETVARGPEGNVYAVGHTTAYGTGGTLIAPAATPTETPSETQATAPAITTRPVTRERAMATRPLTVMFANRPPCVGRLS